MTVNQVVEVHLPLPVMIQPQIYFFVCLHFDKKLYFCASLYLLIQASRACCDSRETISRFSVWNAQPTKDPVGTKAHYFNIRGGNSHQGCAQCVPSLIQRCFHLQGKSRKRTFLITANPYGSCCKGINDFKDTHTHNTENHSANGTVSSSSAFQRFGSVLVRTAHFPADLEIQTGNHDVIPTGC